MNLGELKTMIAKLPPQFDAAEVVILPVRGFPAYDLTHIEVWHETERETEPAERIRVVVS
jgi:hypothetical protein